MKLLVLDGNSILNRAFYGIRLLTTKEGLFTNGIYGFLTMLQKLKNDTNPDAVAIAFDLRAPTFRHKEYTGYKAQRKGMPEELAQQLPNLKELLRLLGYRLLECEGFEADDILGTLAKKCEETGDECILATGDRDSLQLVGPHVTVRLAATKFGQPQVTVYDEAKIMEDYGVTPKQLIDIKAIQGDTSDNIPGVPGIGPKGAGELIQKYHDLDTIYKNIDTLDIRESMRQKLIQHKETAYLSRRLGTICTSAPIDTEIAHYVCAPCDNDAAVRLMAKLEFFSLIDKMGLRAPAVPAEVTAGELVRVAEHTDTAELLKALQKAGRADFIADYPDGVLRLAVNFRNQIHRIDDLKFIKALCADEKIKKNTHDIKPLYAKLDALGVPLRNAEMDTMLAAYLLNPSASGYEPARLAQEYGIPLPEQGELAAAAVLPALTDKLVEEIAKKNQTELLDKIEMPLAAVLARMENIGFAVDAEGIQAYGDVLQKQIDEIQSQIYEAVGYEFNINSPKQLGEALFVKLGLSHGKKTKSGYSTAAGILENLRYEHPAVELVLNYRSMAKLKSTYCEGLLKVVAPDGRIHSSFNQTETRTGRISSTEPNLQNIPVRTELGREMRRFFVARKGWVLVDADYSQIELRVLAHVANDRNMIQAFLNNDDIHRSTAAQVFHMPEDMVTPIMRSRAKAVNFGIVYGISAFSLAKDIGVTRKEADTYIRDYLSHYSGINEYMKRVVAEAKENGYAETMFGRRRYLPELTSSNFNMRSFGERVARNMPIQGAAADIIKIAMIRVENRLQKENMKSRLILQVHDELIVEAPQDEAEKAAKILTEEMQSAASLSVPLVAEAKIGRTWYEAKA
ncbi:DNA polymerase I [Caproiciproducens galactitolivorans]|uniref:DNA polymerase I n=1 Tax=Caproiciproducens galactitolivorans TaxID=642589 RepID=A0A4Z0YAV5_9FIRM|nr:DNA polymerase I [Caproiciproducens galactitolivorans]QEY34916.1 DNA polymerase I [Caproiciproducens galactitolivorans]TGJ76381.1 DNA polymerase I [Caproiciproducens galactitolivorans]